MNMIQSHTLLLFKVLSIFFALVSNGALADVYIDTSQTEEIKISSYELDQRLSITIEEEDGVDGAQNGLITPESKLGSTYSSLPYNHEVVAAAKETSLDPALIHAVIATESRHNPRALSNRGAFGLMQIMPATARRFNVKDRNDPKQNIVAGAKYLRELLTLYKGDLKLTLAAYNAGPSAVKKYSNHIPPYRETMHYVPKVLKFYQQYS
jgi:soluble lytic murein transglycosylase-like protein